MIDLDKRPSFTTGQIAKLCGVSIATVQKWVDAGEMASYWLPMTKSERRVTRDSLLTFMKKYHIPTTELEESKVYRVLMAGVEPKVEGQAKRALADVKITGEVQVCTEAAEFLLLLSTLVPNALIFDYHLPGLDALKLIGSLQQNNRFKNTKLIIVSDLSDEDQKRLEKLKVEAVLPKTYKPAEFSKALTKVMAAPE